MKNEYDVIIIGSGPAGLGAAFHLADNSKLKILLVEKNRISSGGLRNDCKQNYTYPVGFPVELWNKEEADHLLHEAASYLKPKMQSLNNIQVYSRRAENLGVKLIQIKQAHVGTDQAVPLIKKLIKQLEEKKVDVALATEMNGLDYKSRKIILNNHEEIQFKKLVIAPGRAGFEWLQMIMQQLDIEFLDNIVDIGIRVETKEECYPIVKDYYDPKFIFPDKVRTFCTNSGAARVVKENYKNYVTVNGHSFSKNIESNNLVNFALLKTIRLTDPVVSGQQFAGILGQMAMQLSGGDPMMQRVGDFRLGKRSSLSTFNQDLYDFKPTLASSTPGDVSLAIPAKILRHLWKSMKLLDTIVPGILHPSTIIYYPEIKTYANKPRFIDDHFQVIEDIYLIGDGAGTSRGITAAWASGIRAAIGVLNNL